MTLPRPMEYSSQLRVATMLLDGAFGRFAEGGDALSEHVDHLAHAQDLLVGHEVHADECPGPTTFQWTCLRTLLRSARATRRSCRHAAVASQFRGRSRRE